MEKTYLDTEGDINLSSARQEWNAQIASAETRNKLGRDADAFLHQALSTPCLDVLTAANDIYLYNESGESYIDFHGNNVHQLGYNNRYIIERVKAQLDRLAFCPRRFTNGPIIELAERLIALTNHMLTRVLFAPGGTSAISMALKLARIYTGKHKTIAIYDSFHGASMDSIAVGGEQVFKDGLGALLPGVTHIPPVDSYRGMWYQAGQEDADLAYADYLEYLVQKEGDVGAFVLETVRSTTVHVPSKAYWKRVREICDQYKVLLILDEIPIGMGRTGTMFAYEQMGIEPDILVLGKGLGGGIIPLAAILCKESFNIAESVSLGHFTHEKSPLGAAAAIAALDFMEQAQTLTQVQVLSVYMQSRLSSFKEKYSVVGDVRGIGLLWAVELVHDRFTKEKATVAATKVMYGCLRKGLSLKVSDGNILSLYPPLVIGQDALAAALDILEEELANIVLREGQDNG